MSNRLRNALPRAPAAAPSPAPWGTLIPDDQWAIFCRGTDAISSAGVSQLLAGALGLAAYTQHWRNTKDVDVIVRAADHGAAVDAIRSAGFDDYHDTLAYDRSWIFRGFREGVLFDIIWALPNHRVEIDEAWFQRARVVQLRNRAYAATPAEELVRIKLYVMQRERCDWVDVLNILAAEAESMDWRWLVERMGRDLPLLHGVLALFDWLSPHRAAHLPEWVRTQFALPPCSEPEPERIEERHVRLFDSRPWFTPHLPLDRPLER